LPNSKVSLIAKKQTIRVVLIMDFKLRLLAPALLALAPMLGNAQDLPTRPSVNSLTMIGPGCPIGSGGQATEVQGGTPVFLFTEWGLNLADADKSSDMPSVDKFCQENISLGNGPPGYQVRIAAVTLRGWATLETGSLISIAVNTKLGGTQAGVSL
jgi:hypothetical protein